MQWFSFPFRVAGLIYFCWVITSEIGDFFYISFELTYNNWWDGNNSAFITNQSKFNAIVSWIFWTFTLYIILVICVSIIFFTYDTIILFIHEGIEEAWK